METGRRPGLRNAPSGRDPYTAAMGDDDAETLAERLLRTTSLPVFAKDLDDRHLFVNRAGAELVGRTVADIVGRTDAELYGDQVADHFGEGVQLAIEHPDGPVRIEVLSPTPDGPAPHVVTLDALRDDTGRVVGVMGVLAESSERSEAERLLRERTRQLGIAQRVARLGDWRWEPGTDRVHIGRELARLLGDEPPSAWDLPRIASLVHPDDKRRVIGALVAATQGATADEVFRVTLPDGASRWFQVRTDPFGEPGGEVIGTVQDVTDDVDRERERVELERRLHRTQRLESLGRLAGGIAHDFNNLLAVMRIETDLARGSTDRTHPASPHLDSLDATLERAASVVRQLLVFSRHDRHEVAAVDVVDVVRSMIGMIDRVTGDDVVVTTDLDEATPPGVADATQLEQVVMNLVVNARDAMPSGGHLGIHVGTAAPEESPTDVDVDAPDGSSFVILEITDDGMGMDDAVAAQVFEPFFTTKGPEEGTGLGLTTVQTLVARWGGTVSLRSAAGIGTTVELRLRASSTAPASDEETSRSEHSATSRTGTVLVVEDLPALGRLAVTVLERAGYRAVHAMDGDAALVLVGSGLEPDVLVTDVVMPGMSGSELAGRLLDRWPDLDVVYMSGYSAGMLRDRLEVGVEVLAKPFAAADLVAAVDRARSSGG